MGYTMFLRDVYFAFARSLYYDEGLPVKHEFKWSGTRYWRNKLEARLNGVKDISENSLFGLDASDTCREHLECDREACQSIRLLPPKIDDKLDPKLYLLGMGHRILSVAGSFHQWTPKTDLPSWFPDSRQLFSYTPMCNHGLLYSGQNQARTTIYGEEQFRKLVAMDFEISKITPPFIV